MNSESTQGSAKPPSEGAVARSTTAKAAGISRRSLLRAGTGATPAVILSLASSPVAAVPVGQCTLASSFVSVATFKSRNPTGTLGCALRTDAYWLAQANATTPDIAIAPILTRAAYGAAGLLGGVGVSGRPAAETVKDLLLANGANLATSGELGVAQHLAVLIANVESGSMPPSGGFSAVYLQGIWTDYKTTGSYTALTGSLNWSDTDIISWARLLLGYPLPP